MTTTPTVELVFDGDCPNVEQARDQLRQAFDRIARDPTWQEWRGDDPDSPDHVRGLGSPTILVDGRDVAGGNDAGGSCCRVYTRSDGTLRGVPDVEAIVTAIESA